MDKRLKGALVGFALGYVVIALYGIISDGGIKEHTFQWVPMLGTVLGALFAITGAVIASSKAAEKKDESVDLATQIEKLQKLKDMGALSEQEFNDQKSKLLK